MDAIGNLIWVGVITLPYVLMITAQKTIRRNVNLKLGRRKKKKTIANKADETQYAKSTCEYCKELWFYWIFLLIFWWEHAYVCMFVLYFKHKHMCYIVTIADYGSFVCQCFARNFVYFFFFCSFNTLGMGAMTIILWVVFFFFMGDVVPHIHVHRRRTLCDWWVCDPSLQWWYYFYSSISMRQLYINTEVDKSWIINMARWKIWKWKQEMHEALLCV